MLDVISPSDPLTLKSQLPAYIRARGVIAARLQDSGRGTRVFDLSEAGGYRLKFPHAEQCEAMIVNTGGGMAGGDHLALSLSLGPQAVAVCSTQSAEKIYRAERDHAEISVTLTLEDAAELAWLPQETILFDGSLLNRQLTVEMAANATFMACETVVFGRSAMGETVHNADLSDRWDIRRNGKLIFAERLQMAGNVQSLLDRRSLGAGARAIATMLYVAPDAEARLDETRALLKPDDSSPVEWGASAWNGLLCIRGVCPDPSALRRQTALFLNRFRPYLLPRVWQC
jgi:urease accessory protein